MHRSNSAEELNQRIHIPTAAAFVVTRSRRRRASALALVATALGRCRGRPAAVHAASTAFLGLRKRGGGGPCHLGQLLGHRRPLVAHEGSQELKCRRALLVLGLALLLPALPLLLSCSERGRHRNVVRLGASEGVQGVSERGLEDEVVHGHGLNAQRRAPSRSRIVLACHGRICSLSSPFLLLMLAVLLAVGGEVRRRTL
mmetsp:Transcript_7327/g.13544  ORF Transcript_7327/g.13544 Transcript_7327/m.13544 type:complete len:200 (-) Transcript_7327:450-1049(-)